jgi:hypothetical protein
MIFFKPCHLVSFGQLCVVSLPKMCQLGKKTRTWRSSTAGSCSSRTSVSSRRARWIPVAFPDQNPNSWVSDQTLPSKVQLWRMEAQNSLTLQSSNLKHVNSWRLSKDNYSIFVICFDLVTRMIMNYM